jgi:hypothetical protein
MVIEVETFWWQLLVDLMYLLSENPTKVNLWQEFFELLRK